MDWESIVNGLDKKAYVDSSYTSNEEYFSACLKLKRYDLLLNCDSKFFTEEILKEHYDAILDYVNSAYFVNVGQLRYSRPFRDMLIANKNFRVLLALDYKLIIEIQDQEIIDALNTIVDDSIDYGHISNSYAMYRAMKLKKFGAIGGIIPEDEDFYDLFYEEIIQIQPQLVHNSYPKKFVLRALNEGRLEYLTKIGMSHLLETKEIDAYVKDHMDKVIKYNSNEIKDPFHKSKLLFDYFLENKRFDLVIEFIAPILNRDIIEQHEKEILEAIENGTNETTLFNATLFEFCRDRNRIDLCVRFKVIVDDDFLTKYAKEYAKVITDRMPYFKEDNYALLIELIKLKKYKCVESYTGPITEELVKTYGQEIIDNVDNIPNKFFQNKQFLLMALVSNHKEKLSYILHTVLNGSIISSPQFIEYLKKVNKDDLDTDILREYEVAELVIKCDRVDLLFNLFEDKVWVKLVVNHLQELVEKLKDIPYSLRNDTVLLREVLRQRRGDLIHSFSISTFTGDMLEDYIKALPEGSPDWFGVLKGKLAFKYIIKAKRYDLLNSGHFSKQDFVESVLAEHAEEILDSVGFIKLFRYSASVLKIIVKRKQFDLFDKFSPIAYDDEFIETYGEELWDLIEVSLDAFKYDSFFDDHRHSLPGVFNREGVLRSQKLFELALRKNSTSNIHKFNPELFTDDIIEKYLDVLVKISISSSPLKKSKLFLIKCLENGYFDVINHIDDSLITKEIIDQYGDIFIERIRDTGINPYKLSSNPFLLEKAILCDAIDIVNSFNNKAFNQYIVERYGNYLIEHIECTEGLPKYINLSEWGIKSSAALLRKLIDEGNYDLAREMHFDTGRYNPVGNELIDTKFNELLSIIKGRYDCTLAKDLLCNFSFILLFMDVCELEEIDLINPDVFERSDFPKEKYPRLIEWIQKINKNSLPGTLATNESFKQYCIENNPELIRCFTINPKKTSIERSNKEEVISEYGKYIDATPEEIEKRIDDLYSMNDDILNTLVIGMLDKKYEVLGIKHLLTICLYPDLQNKVLSLNNNELQLFNKLLNITDNIQLDTTGILYKAINNFKYYRKLVTNASVLTDEQLNNLLLVLQRKDNIYNITTIEDLLDVNFHKKMSDKFTSFDEQISSINNISLVKEMLVLKMYGLNKEEASFILDRYCLSVNAIKNSNMNEKYKTILLDLIKISNCQDIEELKFMYSTSKMLLPDFSSMLFLESSIRSEYARMYNETLYRVKDEDYFENTKGRITNPEVLDKLSNINYNGNRLEIYMVQDDFNMCIHSLGAYSGYERPEDFMNDWFRPKMASHGICTSYIGNNQIANARAYHPIIGFDTIESEGMLLSANYDIGSSRLNTSYNTSTTRPCNFLPPEDDIHFTRHTHNELVVERMKYINGRAYKRTPSYIAFLVDDVNNKYNYMTKEELIEEFERENVPESVIEDIKSNTNVYFVDGAIKNKLITPEQGYKISCAFYYEEVVQASSDFGIPIVIVDRLYFAKKEKAKCDTLLNDFKETLNLEALDNLLLIFFDNMVGCHNYIEDFELEYNKIFSDNSFDILFNEIVIYIYSIEDENTKSALFGNFLKCLELENTKRQMFRGAISSDVTGLEIYINMIKDNINKLAISKEDLYGSNIIKG